MGAGLVRSEDLGLVPVVVRVRARGAGVVGVFSMEGWGSWGGAGGAREWGALEMTLRELFCGMGAVATLMGLKSRERGGALAGVVGMQEGSRLRSTP